MIKFLYYKVYVYEVIDLGANWFESATVDTNIISYRKHKDSIQKKINAYRISLCDDIIKAKNDKLSGGEKECFIFTKKDYTSWIILNENEKSILEKIHRFKALKDWSINIYRGVLTGFNEAFIIDEETKNILIKEDKKSTKLIKPLLRGRDIKRYSYVNSGLYIICTFPALKLNIDNYPAIKKYLKSFGKRLEQSGGKGSRKKTNNKWFETQDTIAYYEDFGKPKIVYPETTTSANFYYDGENFIPDKTNFIMTGGNLKYIMAVLSSKAGFYIFYHFYSNIQLGSTGFQYRKDSIEPFPIPEPDKETENRLVNLVDDIIRLKKGNKDTSEIEAKVDEIVYSLYNLSEEEIRIIESN